MRDTFTKPRGVLSAINSAFIDVDREATARRLRLAERGAETGALNLPATDTEALDVVETEIVAEIGDYARRAKVEASEQLSTYNQRLLQLNRLNEAATIAGTARATLGDLPARAREWQNRIAIMRDTVTESFDELAAFRTAHGLQRPAHHVPHKASTLGAVFVAWLLDAAMNTAILRINDDLGILGGAIAAGLVAGFNVFLLGYIAGRWLRPQTIHRDRARRIAGYTGLTLWLVVLIGWNLIAAHYRDAKALLLPAPEQAALRMVIEQPFALDGILTIMFFFAGIVFGLAAAARFFAMDDPYPGYGRLVRQHQRRCDDYAEEVAAAKSDLRLLRDAGVERATALRAELTTQFSEHGQIIARRSAFIQQFQAHLQRLEREANALLECYRMANRQARSDAPPAHFNKAWTMEHGTPADELPVPEMPGNLAGQVGAAQASLERAIDEINTAFTEAETSFLSVDELRPEVARG